MEEFLAHAALGQRRLPLDDVPLHLGRPRHHGAVRDPDGQEVRRPEERRKESRKEDLYSSAVAMYFGLITTVAIKSKISPKVNFDKDIIIE